MSVETNQMLRRYDRDCISNQILSVIKRRAQLHTTQAPRPMSRFARLFWPPEQYEVMQNLMKNPCPPQFDTTCRLLANLPTRLGHRVVTCERSRISHAVYFDINAGQQWHPQAVSNDIPYVREFLRWHDAQHELQAEQETAQELLYYVRYDVVSSGQLMFLMGSRLLNAFEPETDIGRRLLARKGKPYRVDDMPHHLQGKRIRESFDWLMEIMTPGLFIDPDIKFDGYWSTTIEGRVNFSLRFDVAMTPEHHMQAVAERVNSEKMRADNDAREIRERELGRMAEDTRDRNEWQPD